MAQAPVRSWTAGASVLFPLVALAAAVLTIASESPRPALIALLVVYLVPWALLAGGVAVHPVVVSATTIVPMALLTWNGALGAIFLGLVLVLWLAAADQPRAYALSATAVTIVVSFVGPAHHDKGIRIVEGPIYFAAGALFALLTGELLRRERRLTAALARAQQELSDAATERERARIAREIHDVIGHALTVVQLHVAGARRQLARDPAAADTTLARAEDLGRESLDHLRQVVGLLRYADGSGTAPPQPTAGDVPRLVEEARSAGLDVRLSVEGDLGAVDVASGLAAYRIVQESLANARHHAPGAPVTIELRVRQGAVEVVVENAPAPRPVHVGGPGGSGLTGMRERAGALHGTFDAGPTAAGGWSVRCTLPAGSR